MVRLLVAFSLVLLVVSAPACASTGTEPPPLPDVTRYLRDGQFALTMVYGPRSVDRRRITGDIVEMTNAGFYNSDSSRDPQSRQPADMLVMNGRIKEPPIPACQGRPVLLIGPSWARIISVPGEVHAMRQNALNGRWPYAEKVAAGLSAHAIDPDGAHQREFYVQAEHGVVFFRRYGTEACCRREAARAARKLGIAMDLAHPAFCDGGLSCYRSVRPYNPETIVVTRLRGGDPGEGVRRAVRVFIRNAATAVIMSPLR